MIRRPPRSTLDRSSAASDVYKRQILNRAVGLEGLSKMDAEKMIEIPINATMPYLSSNFAFANSHHQPFILKFPMDTASIVFQDTAKDMAALARKLRAE